VLRDFDDNVRMLTQKDSDSPLARNIRRIRADGDAEFPDLQSLGEGQLACELLKIGEDFLAVAQDDFAERRGRDPLSAAGQIGLRHAERVRRPAEVPMARKSPYDFELADSRHAMCCAYQSISGLRLDLERPFTLTGVRLQSGESAFGSQRAAVLGPRAPPPQAYRIAA
jgi:hypothetical protein